MQIFGKKTLLDKERCKLTHISYASFEMWHTKSLRLESKINNYTNNYMLHVM